MGTSQAQADPGGYFHHSTLKIEKVKQSYLLEVTVAGGGFHLSHLPPSTPSSQHRQMATPAEEQLTQQPQLQKCHF